MFSRDLVSSVREMLDRHYDIYVIASKLKLDPILIQAVVDFINGTLT